MGVCGIFRPPVQGGSNELISKFLSSMILYNHPSYFKSGEINSCRLSPLPTIGRMNTQKKSAANSLRFWKYSSSKIWPDPPFLASVRRVIDLSDLWPAFIPVCNKIQKSKLLLGVIFTHIFKIWSQKHDILFSFYARGTSTWALVTYDNYFSMFKIMRFLNKRRQGAHITYM